MGSHGRVYHGISRRFLFIPFGASFIRAAEILDDYEGMEKTPKKKQEISQVMGQKYNPGLFHPS